MKRVLALLVLMSSLVGCWPGSPGRVSCAELVQLSEMVTLGLEAAAVDSWVEDSYSCRVIPSSATNTITWEKAGVVYQAETSGDVVTAIRLRNAHVTADRLIECLGPPELYSAVQFPGRWGRGHDISFGMIFPRSGVVAGSYRRFRFGSVDWHNPKRSWLLDGIVIHHPDASSTLLDQTYGVGGVAEDNKALYAPWPDDWDDIEVVEWLAR